MPRICIHRVELGLGFVFIELMGASDLFFLELSWESDLILLCGTGPRI